MHVYIGTERGGGEGEGLDRIQEESKGEKREGGGGVGEETRMHPAVDARNACVRGWIFPGEDLGAMWTLLGSASSLGPTVTLLGSASSLGPTATYTSLGLGNLL